VVNLVEMSGAPIPEELRHRDPEFIRAVLPPLWLASTIWFRAEVNGFENVPDEPVLFVGNHSGGGSTPDTFIFLLAYNTFFTVEGRPLYGLAHDTVTAAPVIGGWTRKLGVVPAANSFAECIFETGASALVYPGGDVEALRPWRDRNKIVFSGRKGFLRLAHRCNVKIVPVVATGGHDTLIILNDGRRTAKLLRLDKLARVKSMPMTLSIPWGLSPLPLPHLPLPAKIRMQVLDPIDVRARFGDKPDWDHAFDYVTSVMQVGLSKLASRTVVPMVR
jgi:1-acyl-sn-glycerol-3-phosphate acyltransferase